MLFRSLIAVFVLQLFPFTAPSASELASGEALYNDYCAQCHDGAVSKAPPRNMLELFTATAVVRAMETGVMQAQAMDLDPDSRRRIAEFVTGKSLASEVPVQPPACKSKTVAWHQDGLATLWGGDTSNQRNFASRSSISIDQFPHLELAWAYGFPGAIRARSQPAVAGDTLIIGSETGDVLALDRDTGCVRWRFTTTAEVRTAIVLSPEIPSSDSTMKTQRIAFFGDLVGNVYALDANTGQLIWRDRPDNHPSLTITAAPTLHNGVLYVALSSLEVVAAADPEYQCCTFRGAVVAYNALSGNKNWIGYTISEPSEVVGKNAAGTAIYAPSGAPVWGTPVIDPIRQQLYVGTGESYSSPASPFSDAIIAMSLEDGSINWRFQATAGDAWNIACEMEDRTNCPSENGPDYDFGAATLLTSDVRGNAILIAGQKSGAVFGIDPESGRLVWKNKLGRGGIQGGVHFGMATDGNVLYVPMSDFYGGPRWPGRAYPGMFAVDITTGKQLWYTETPDVCNGKALCDPGLSAAISAISGGVVAGSMDGRLRAYDKATGVIVWQFDSLQSYKAVNGSTASGGSFGGASGPVFDGNMMFVTSGYGLYNHMPGNVLLAFKISGSTDK